MGTNDKISISALPIYMIGAGGIVTTAHLPAYRLAGYTVKGIYDPDLQKARAAAEEFAVPEVYDRLEDMLNAISEPVVFDLAVPPSALPDLLEQLPGQASVLMQKPMGEDLAAAGRILEIIRHRNISAAVNFQLRYAPFMLEAKKMISEGLIGELTDLEVNVNVYTPWNLWSFLFDAPRVEIVYHSIHYVDLVRSLMGEPQSVYAKTTGHPAMKELASVRSCIIMDYGHYRRADILTNHCHGFGTEKQQSYIKLEGTEGAILIKLGVLQQYPDGVGDAFEFFNKHTDGKWQTKKLEGSWFPHAFIGSMEQLMLTATGKLEKPDNSAEDAFHTMACVEAAYESSAGGGVKPAGINNY